MSRMKLDFGIDLGTSNSAIAYVQNGEVVIVKSEKYLKDTTPSCVHFNKKEMIFTGDDALNKYRMDVTKAFSGYTGGSRNPGGTDTFIEFKRTMGTDKEYFSANMNRSYLSEELSSEILKTLKNYVINEPVVAAAITVPAKFRQNQIDATQKAAELAGFKYCELLQEPIAASLAYGIDAKKAEGRWLVFDMGGGTFDAALLNVDEGIMKVIDTAGDNHLGGKDIDYAVVDGILIPFVKERYRIESILNDEKGKIFLREALKWYGEEIKIALSSRDLVDIFSDDPLGTDEEGVQIELDLTVTREAFEQAANPIFQRAVDICQRLLESCETTPDDLEIILPVGGPTLSRSLRDMISEQICPRLATHIDPMSAVARGAAIFASTRDLPEEFRKKNTELVQLTLKYAETTVETVEKLGIRVERDAAAESFPEKLFAEVTRKDRAWSSGRIEIKDDAEVIDILLEENKSNGFDIAIQDEKGTLFGCEPSEFFIIQGVKAATATLTHSLCIGGVDVEKEKQLLLPLDGLQKNQSLPARGKEVFKTQKPLHPGNAEDVIRVPIYEGEPFTRAVLNEWAGQVQITGEHVSEYIPEDSDIEISVDIDASRRMKLTAFIPYIDETIELDVPENRQKEFDASVLEKEINRAEEILAMLESDSRSMDMDALNGFIRLNRELNELTGMMEKGRGDYNTRTKVMERLREVMKELDRLEEEGKWSRVSRELQNALKRYEICHNRCGDDASASYLEEYRNQVNDILDRMDVPGGVQLTREIRSAGLSLASREIGIWIRYIRNFRDKFDTFAWKDAEEAKALLDEGLESMKGQPTRSELENIVRSLFDLLPEAMDTNPAWKDPDLLKK